MTLRSAGRLAGWWIGSLALVAAPGTARASGLEVPDNGTVAFGRGGAFVARASDPTALIHNPAGLVALPGLQVILGSNFSSFSHCFQRSGNYDSSDTSNISTAGTIFSGSNYANGTTPYPRICNNAAIGVVPHLIVSYRLNRHVAVAFGAYGPNSTGANQDFPDTVMTSAGLAPSPGRYLLYQKDLFMAYLSFGAAFAPVHWLRFGVILQPSYANFQFGIMSNYIASAAQSPDSDLHLGLQASGIFLAANAGVQVIAGPYLSFGAAAHFNETAELHGTATTIANYYSSNPTDRTQSSFNIDRMTVPLPWTFRGGVRFVMPRAGHTRQSDEHPRTPYDPMSDDVFDVEAVFSTETMSRLSVVDFTASGSINVGGLMVPAPSHVVLNSNLQDVYGARLGGDWNVIPGRLAVRAGFSFDTGAETAASAQIHLPGYQTYGVHVGGSVRFGAFTASLAYGHTFMDGLDASNGNRTVISTGGSITPMNCMNGAGPGACTVNQGTYTASLDQLSASLAARF